MTAYIRNNKTLVLIITVLLLSNLVLLYFLLRNDKWGRTKASQGGHITPREYMKQTLRDSVGFSEEQVAKYEELANKHKETMRPMFERIQSTKDSFFRLLQQRDVPDSVVNAYLEKIGQAQKNIDEKSYRHFRSLQQLCTDGQREKFDSVIQKIIKHMIAPRKGGSGGGKDKNKK